MNAKTRIKTQFFMDGTSVAPRYTVEVLMNRRWLPLGDAGKVTRFSTEGAAQAAADKLAKTDVAVG